MDHDSLVALVRAVQNSADLGIEAREAGSNCLNFSEICTILLEIV